MFSRVNRSTAKVAANQLNRQQVRNMATAKQVQNRIKSITNIAKITSAMEMIASARVKTFTDNMEVARVFTKDVKAVFGEPSEEAKAAITTDKKAYSVYCTDKGLCGAVNSTLVRQARKELAALKEANEMPKLIIIGDRGKGGLRSFEKDTDIAITDITKAKSVGFRAISEVADVIRERGFDQYDVLHNEFVNMLTFKAGTTSLFSEEIATAELPKYNRYRFAGLTRSSTFQNFYEYQFGLGMWELYSETVAVEFSSRMNAMSNSSKSAKEMKDELQMQYNRMRQAKITTELIEVISGATASEETED